MTPAEIRAKHAEHIAKLQDLRKQIEHVQVDLKHLALDCQHPDKYAHNAMGRDPGGAHCPDCGKSW